MERIILHSDLNNFYASVECMENPQLKNKAVAVCGSPQNRHGVVLAKNIIAKSKGIKTGDTVNEAKQKCPNIIFVQPRFDKYIEISKKVRNIYYDYTNLIEPFGIDECWLDVTNSVPLFPSGIAIANEIKERVKNEIGITVSIGVSFNKIFAKLGSDMKKPDAITVISKDDFKDKIWALPINELLYAGRSTTKTLGRLNIFTIGDMAKANPYIINQHLGKNGLMLQLYAQGKDTTPVNSIEYKREIKSIGNGTTMPFDVTNVDDVKIILTLLSESVSKRLINKGLYCQTISLGIKFNTLETIERQMPIQMPTNSAELIFKKALEIYNNEKITQPIRALSIRCSNVINKIIVQESLLSQYKRFEKYTKLDDMREEIRQEYGWNGLQKAIMLVNKRLSNLNPTDDNTLQKIAFYK